MKKNVLLKSGLAFLLGLGIGLEVQAAEPVAKLTQLQGKVLVNKGKVFTQAQVGMPLERGYRLLIPAGGSAQVVYKDGCVLPLGQNSLLTIEGKNQCSEGAIVAQLNPGVRLAQAGAAPAGTAAGGGAAAGGATTVAGITVPALIVGAAITGVVIAGATSSDGGGGGGGRPISPQ